jgi:hypothetical protein
VCSGGPTGTIVPAPIPHFVLALTGIVAPARTTPRPPVPTVIGVRSAVEQEQAVTATRPIPDPPTVAQPGGRAPGDRLAAAGGAAFTLLAVASVAVAPTAPDPDASADAVRAYLDTSHGPFAIGAALMALAVMALCPFFAYVHRRLVATDRGTALPAMYLIASAGAIVLALTGALLQGLLARHIGPEIDDAALLLLHRTWNLVAFMGPPLLTTVALLAVAVRIARTAVFPRWLGAVAAVSAVGGAVTGLMSLATDVRPPVLLDLGSFLLACLFMTGVSVHAFTGRAAR